MKRMTLGLAALSLLGGCASSQMKSTPFYSGLERVYTEKPEDRVNLWPIGYYREPALSVLWPLFSLTDDHLAVRPVYSQYRQGGKDSGYDEFNFLWPFCQFDTKHDEHRIFPLYWGEDHFDLFPVFFWTRNWCVIGPYATHKTEDRGTLFPLSWWDLDKQRFWYLAGLGGYWRCNDYRVNHWALPFYLRNRSGFYSLPFSRLDREGLTEDLYLCGLGGREFASDGYRRSWAFPFYYHDKDSCYTLLYGNTATSDWLMPFYFRNETDFHTPVWSVRANEKTGEKGFFSLPLLSAAFWNTDTCARSWYALLGLAGSKTNTTGTHHEHWAFPLYHWDEGRSFTSLAYGWNGGGSGRTNTWWAAGLVGTRSGAVEGEWAFPFYSRRKNVVFDKHMALLDAPRGQADKSPSFWLASGNRRSYLLLSDYDESFRAHRGSHKGGDKLMMRYHRKVGNWLFLDRTADRTVYYDEAKNVVERDEEMAATSFLLFLYRAQSKLDRLTHKSSARCRVLWKLWDYERTDDDVKIDTFPFFTYDSKANGFSKTSLLWRLFRNEYDPRTDKRSVDVLFIPVWR